MPDRGLPPSERAEVCDLLEQCERNIDKLFLITMSYARTVRIMRFRSVDDEDEAADLLRRFKSS
ncbi:MAG: hypothetical protein ACLVEV_03315 [Lachnospiraceae bacterium]